MKKYIGTKIINATPMDRLAYNIFRLWKLPDDENGTDKGYLVEYTDGGEPNTKEYAGYVSWSPKDLFEKSYKETNGLTFGLAIEAMKEGHKVARAGWNGKGMFLVYQKGYPNGIPANKQTAEAFGIEEGTNFIVQPYVQMKTVDGSCQMWTCSQSDMLANDWEIIYS